MEKRGAIYIMETLFLNIIEMILGEIRADIEEKKPKETIEGIYI